MLSIKLLGVSEVRGTMSQIDVSEYLEDMVADVTVELARYGASITPVVTGSMRNAWTGEAYGLVGRVFIDPSAVNSRSGVPVEAYASIISDRYGIMADLEMMLGQLGAEVIEVIRW